MENEFRRFKEEQSNSTRKSSSSISSKDELLSSRTRDNTGFISNGTSNSREYYNYEKESSRYKTLSKQAMKEYAMKKANSSSFDWFEDEEELI